MSKFDRHKEKYEMFKNDALNEDISIPLRIEAYFYAAFHLIESLAAQIGLHIEKHQKVRSFLEKNHELVGDETDKLWRSFREIEQNLRPGQVYGGQINGQKLTRARELFELIEAICERNLDDPG